MPTLTTTTAKALNLTIQDLYDLAMKYKQADVTITMVDLTESIQQSIRRADPDETLCLHFSVSVSTPAVKDLLARHGIRF